MREWLQELTAGSTVAQALDQCGIWREFADLQPGEVKLGVWGKQAGYGHVLHDGDRIEIYRDLLVDPKVARHERFRHQGTKGAGLFATRRLGAKAGY